MTNPTDSEALCAALNFFAVPGALADLSRNRFLAWNPGFLEDAQLTPEEIRQTPVDQVIGLEWPAENEASECDTSPVPVHFVACAVRPAGSSRFKAGCAFKRADDFVLVLLDSQIDPAAAQEFLSGLSEGKKEENERVKSALGKVLAEELPAAVDAAKKINEKLGGAAPSEESLQTITKTMQHLPEAVDQALESSTEEPTALENSSVHQQ